MKAKQFRKEKLRRLALKIQEYEHLHAMLPPGADREQVATHLKTFRRQLDEVRNTNYWEQPSAR